MSSRAGKLEVWYSKRCEEHVPSLGHPERPARVRAIVEGLSQLPEGWSLQEVDPLEEDDALGVVKWLHSPGYIERFRRAVSSAPTFLDTHDNPVSKGTWNAAVTAAGLAAKAALEMANGRLKVGFLVVRPPGHHALPSSAMGFCFFNNIALAAEVLVRSLQEAVLIADFDVHHGNGTQAIFYNRPDVAYLSVHQYPFYPGTGSAEEVGEGPGRGYTRNFPLAAGADDPIYCTALEDGLEELGSRVKPVSILVSAGFDAHANDPLGGMRVSTEGYRRMGKALAQAALQWSEGRILILLEGGYDLKALKTSSRALIEGIDSTLRQREAKP